MNIDLRQGDCLEVLKTIPDNSIDSVVTDPPYHLTSITKRFGKEGSAPAQYGTDGAFARASKGFMGKEWDGGDIAFRTDVWKECLRVLKPGGHLLSFGGSRTYHKMAVAIEDAGFEIRDQIMWIYGSGFPKSHNIGKKVEGYEGWGTALKPAHEPIVMARKPLSEKSIAENVIKWGTGGINIDECRIGSEMISSGKSKVVGGGQLNGANTRVEIEETFSNGRFPANIMFDDDTDEDWKRYFYCPKTSKKERNMGMDVEVGVFHQRPRREDGTIIYKETHHEEWKEAMNKLPRKDKTSKAAAEEKLQGEKGNTHPTVKPLKLMEYLITLVTPKGGVVMDCFMGSGSTGVAARNLGFKFIGIEREQEYMDIAKQRITQPVQTKLDI